MRNRLITRRVAVSGVVGAGLALSVSRTAWSQSTDAPTAAVDTSSGKVRGVRRQGVSRFLGIPYGDDTGKHRFQPPRAPQPWAGVRDCLAYGAIAPQGIIRVSGAPALSASAATATPPSTDTVAGAMSAVVRDSMTAGQESEDCLFLNVYTPDASSTRKRPVMVWLHGGGFALGSGGIPSTDGDELCRFGDVVVVALNHRLNAMGYLYLGALHDDFADSGNAGHLDIILALQWVRDNIANFGGDANNVTIFGQSGGGGKVGALLAMPPARGLFHKAIEQSGPAVKLVDRDAAAGLAERMISALGVARADAHKLQTMEAKTIIEAATKAQSGTAALGGQLAPTVDGRTLPAHPFDPIATEVSRDIPLVIGATKDESTMFLAFDPQFGRMTAEQARQRFGMAGPRAAAAYELYSRRRPNDPPTYWVTSFMTDQMMWSGSVRQAERKSMQNAAPVFLYRVDWHTTVAKGALRATHGTEMPFVFRHLDGFGAMNGDGAKQRELMEKFSQAWINFARTGNPSQKGLAWPRYDTKERRTMIFDAETRVVPDPDRNVREFWSAA